MIVTGASFAPCVMSPDALGAARSAADTSSAKAIAIGIAPKIVNKTVTKAAAKNARRMRNQSAYSRKICLANVTYRSLERSGSRPEGYTGAARRSRLIPELLHLVISGFYMSATFSSRTGKPAEDAE